MTTLTHWVSTTPLWPQANGLVERVNTWKAIPFLCGHSSLHDVVSSLSGVVSSLYDGVSPLRDVVLSLCCVVSPLCDVLSSLRGGVLSLCGFIIM